MKKLLMSLAFFCTLFSYAQSQHFKIYGKVVSEEGQLPLESATIYLEKPKDSSLVTYTISKKDGSFQLEDDTYEKKLNLFISYVGYKTYYQSLDLNSEAIHLGKIILTENANALDEVVIKSEAPIIIKKDTLEFKVSSFKTAKGASVEDLLKQLPGVEVDEQGNITVNGKPVNKILVNGKSFFGDDPTITTRNLTKDIIDKVQITDAKTKSEAFTGEKGDEDNKTLNLTLKEENNRGVFGRLAAGVGTDARYEYAGLVNLFDNDQRLSLLAGGNNINSPGFSFGEIRRMFGGLQSLSFNGNGSFGINGRTFGGGEGITISNNSGVNYVNKFGKIIDVTADYFRTDSQSDNKMIINRENILPDSRYFSNSRSDSRNDSNGHRANVNLEIKVDSTLLINVRPSFYFSKSRNTYNQNEESLDELGQSINGSTLSSYVETIGESFRNNMNVTKKFGNGGSFLRLSLDTGYGSTESDDYINSETYFQDGGDDVVRNQFSDGKEKNNSILARATYRFPLKPKTFFLDFKYEMRLDKTTSVKSTYDYDDATQEYSSFNLDLSTDFEYKNNHQIPSLRLQYEKEKWRVRMEAGHVFRTLENKDGLRPELNYAQDFRTLEFSSSYRYKFTQNASMYLAYSLRNDPPQISQLRPFVDVSDPLNTVTGNPNLKPSNVHNIYLRLNGFDYQTKSGYFMYANVAMINDGVVAKRTIDENLVRNTTYENVDGAYWFRFGGSYSKNVKMDTLRTLRYRLGINSTINRLINYNNDQQYSSNTMTLMPDAGVTFTWKEIMEIVPNYGLSLSKTTYDIDNFDDREFLSHNFGMLIITRIPKKLEWQNSINYNYNPNVSTGFQKSSWFWNFTLAYSILDDKATITLKAYDLLNQNTNARRAAAESYIEDTQSTVLEQYFMLSFSWKFNTLGKKGETEEDDFSFF